MILRICVVIPTCDDLRTISEVVNGVLLATPFPVLIIDNGSETPVENALYSWEVRQALEVGRVRVVRFQKNCGKGGALQFAIGDLVGLGFTHMFSVDASGAYRAQDILKLSDLAQQYPWDLIIGDRQLNDETLPQASKFGKKITDFFVSYQTGSRIKDSRSGFRLYPLFALQTMKFFAAHEDFEVEVLIRLLWNGISVREVNIDAPVLAAGDLGTQPKRFFANARVSALNGLLAVVSLFKTHRRPKELAAALGLGVFIGCTPFFGFHTLIIAALAFVFRLNFIVMWLGTHVSTPPLAPLVVMSEIWIGRHWLHIGAEGGAKQDFFQWMAGSSVLGLMLGVLAMILTYGIASSIENYQGRTRSSGIPRLGGVGRRFLQMVIRFGGTDNAYMLALLVTPYLYIFAVKARRGLNEYWKIREPGEIWRTRQRRILRHFYLHSQISIDRISLAGAKGTPLGGTAVGVKNITDTLAEKPVLILLSAQMGAWDLAAALVDRERFGVSLSAPIGDADLVPELRAQLKSGGTLSLMGDVQYGAHLELIPFMGKLAPFDMTLFNLAAQSQVPMIFSFGFKGENGRYDFFAGPPKTFAFAAGQPREIQCYDWAKEFVHDMEDFLRRYPDEWFNFYPFWSSLPDGSK